MEDYKIRMIREYEELKDRYFRLHRLLIRWDAGTLDFTPTCSRGLLERQAVAMREYMTVLEIRAEVEKIALYPTCAKEDVLPGQLSIDDVPKVMCRPQGDVILTAQEANRC